MMLEPVLEVLAGGGGLTIQDAGRPGWKRFGIPPGGAMDADSAAWANRLAGNAESQPVVEAANSGARFRVLARCEFALAGADGEGSHARWTSFAADLGEEIVLGPIRSGIWTYLAVRGGFAAPRWFGSASVNPRAGFGGLLMPGTTLCRHHSEHAPRVARRFLAAEQRPRFDSLPELPIWRGPEWDALPAGSGDALLGRTWTISPRVDRTGYRLDGEPLDTGGLSIPSSPAAEGIIQVPPDGRPIVLLRDGPTVGGYPRLAILDASAVSRMTQCAPGTPIRFRSAQ